MVPGVPPETPPAVPMGIVCEASVTGALDGSPAAPPAQLGGTDIPPIEVPAPAEASTGAAPIPPAAPAAGPTSLARAEPSPPMSAPAVAGPDSAVSRPPLVTPIMSEAADA